MKKKVAGSNEVLYFTQGCLAREDKVQIVPGKKSFRVQLR